MPKDEYTIRQCFIGEAYPPSVRAVADLKPMLISDLRLETHHTGRVLLLRTFGHPSRIQAVQNAVEDANGNVDRVAVYNTDTGITPERLLPKGAVLAVKEPFYKTTADGGYSLRVDHPSDLILLSASDALVPQQLAPRLIELDVPAPPLKVKGNDAYGKKDYHAAIDCYTQALAACSEAEEPLRHDLHRNRAIVNLLLSRFEAALADAQAAIIEVDDASDGKTAELNGKAYYRAARAAYCLRKFRQAQAYYQDVKRCTPGDVDAERELKRTVCRLEEERVDGYDFAAMSKAASVKANRLDYADFTAMTAIKNAGKRGRGLFAIRGIKAGDLVLCEKAFGVAFSSDQSTETYMMLNLNTNRGAVGPHATLLFDLVQKLSHNPEQAAKYFDLYDGNYEPRIQPQVIDGTTVIDTFRTASISEYNRFGCSTVSSSDQAGKAQSDWDSNKDEILGSVGVWLTASAINHACDGNAIRAFIGDMMVIHACRDIAQGEEITMRYCNPKHEGSVATRAHIKKTWDFECDCAICETDASTPKSQRNRRQALLAQAKTFLATHKLSVRYQPVASILARAEKLRIDLEATYDSFRFAGQPRLALTALSLWLCQAYSSRSPQRKVVECADHLLRDLGFGIQVV